MTPLKYTPTTIPNWLVGLRFSKKNLKRVSYALFGCKFTIIFFNRESLYGFGAYVYYTRQNKIGNISLSRPWFKKQSNYQRWSIFIHELAHVYDNLIQEYNWYSDNGKSDHSLRFSQALTSLEEELNKLDIKKTLCYNS